MAVLLILDWGAPRTVFASVAQQQVTPRVWLPIIMHDFPPPATISRYMGTTDAATLYNLGCARAQAAITGTNTIIILDFGNPSSQNGYYGAVLPAYPNPFGSINDIRGAVENFLVGYHYCAPQDVYLTLAVGVTNSGSGVTSAHGTAWAGLVNDLNAFIDSGTSWAYQLTAWGGIDAEPGFGPPTAARAWADAFDGARTGRTAYVNFGSCDSCAYYGCPTCSPLNGWTYEDIWHISYGIVSAWPLPEIYNSAHADQWYRLSVWAYQSYGIPVGFKGELTEWNACQEVDNCAGIDNPPTVGYMQLWSALNSDSRTAQLLGWSSDISWYK
jgi:hypothetical protein